MIPARWGGGIPFIFPLALCPNVYTMGGLGGLDPHVGGPYLL